MIVNSTNATKMAIFMALFGGFTLITGYFILLNEKTPLVGYWYGMIIAAILLVAFLLRSYQIGKRKLTPKENRNVTRTAASARQGWIWAAIGFCVYLIARYVFEWDWVLHPAPALVGGFGAVCLLMGIAILLDNFWLKAMFAWNNVDPDLRKLFNSK